MSEERKAPRLSRVTVASIKNRPDPNTLETFLREKEQQDRLEADLKVFFKEILTRDEMKVLSLSEGLFGEGKYSLDDISKRLAMSEKEIVMLRLSLWRKLEGYRDKLKIHLESASGKKRAG
jgi:hypothetical protein